MTDRPSEDGRPETRKLLTAGVVLVAVALSAAIVAVAVFSTPDEVTLVIPEGAAAQVDAGTSPDVVGAEESFDVGTNLVIENDDRRPHTLGPLVIAAGESEEITLDSEDVLRWSTTLHPRREITVVVE